jgi:hypothetical protein
VRACPAAPGRPQGASLSDAFDFPASKSDVAISIRAARAQGVADRDIYPFLCDDGLLPGDFVEPSYESTAAELRRVIRGLEREARPDDRLLFVASNHGEQQGLLMAARYDELGEDEPLHLTPGALDECLSRLAGPQLVIIATCHSGVFLQLGARPDRLVITACNEHEIYHVSSDAEDAHSPLLRALLGGWCGVTLQDDPAPPRVSLDEAFDAARALEMTRKDLDPSKRTEPHRSGRVRWP